MLSTESVTASLAAWAQEILPELTKAYDYATGERMFGFPDLAVEVVFSQIGERPADGRLAKLQQIQQRQAQIFYIELVVVTNPDPDDVAEAEVKDFSDRLLASVVADPTLGGRFDFINDNFRVDFRPPFVEFDDGSRGRVATLSLQVGSLI